MRELSIERVEEVGRRKIQRGKRGRRGEGGGRKCVEARRREIKRGEEEKEMRERWWRGRGGVEELTAFGEEVHECVDLTAAVEVLELCGAVESKVVDAQLTLASYVSVEKGRLWGGMEGGREIVWCVGGGGRECVGEGMGKGVLVVSAW